MESFINNPDAQEKYHEHNLSTQVIPKAKKLQNKYISMSAPTEMFMGLIHFLGSADADTYLSELQATGSYDKAQEKLNAVLADRYDGKVPKNMKVVDYLSKIKNHL